MKWRTLEATKAKQIHFILSITIFIAYKTEYCKKVLIFPNWSGFLCFLPFKSQNFLNSLYFFEVSSYICDLHILPKMQYFLVISEFNPTWNVAMSWMHTAKKNVKKHKTVNLQNKYFKFAKISRLNINIREHILSKLITIAFLVSTFTENWAKHVIFYTFTFCHTSDFTITLNCVLCRYLFFSLFWEKAMCRFPSLLKWI